MQAYKKMQEKTVIKKDEETERDALSFIFTVKCIVFKEKIMEILKMLNDNGTTIICVTHDKEVAAYCKRVYVMNNGNLLSESE